MSYIIAETSILDKYKMALVIKSHNFLAKIVIKCKLKVV